MQKAATARATGGALLEVVRASGGDDAGDVGAGDDGAGDVGAGARRRHRTRGARASREMDDQHGPGTCAKTEELSSQVGAGSKQSALLLVYAQRGAAKKCAARLLLASVECVGWARLQGSHMATTVRAPEKARQRRAREEVVCWRRRPNQLMTTFKCLLRQGPSQGSRWHMNRPASESRAHRKDWGGGSAGGQG